MKLSETFWLTVIGFIQDFTILVGVILFLILPKQQRKHLKELGILLILSVVTDLLAWAGIFILHTNMNIVPNIFRLLNLPLVVLIYRHHVPWKNRNLIAYITIGVFEIFAIINLFFIQGPSHIDSYSASLTSFCIVLISMTYFFASESRSPEEPASKSPMHWINIGFLFYYSTILFIYLWVDYLVNVLQSNLIGIWMVHNTLGVIFYAILCYALHLSRIQSKSIPATQTLG